MCDCYFGSFGNLPASASHDSCWELLATLLSESLWWDLSLATLCGETQSFTATVLEAMPYSWLEEKYSRRGNQLTAMMPRIGVGWSRVYLLLHICLWRVFRLCLVCGMDLWPEIFPVDREVRRFCVAINSASSAIEKKKKELLYT